MRHSEKYYGIAGKMMECVGRYVSEEEIGSALRIAHLSKKHHAQCENSCNGSGSVRGLMYYAGRIDDYARREYGAGVLSAYPATATGDWEETVFDIEIARLEKSIQREAKAGNMEVEFQHDPRGSTVKLRVRVSRGEWVGITQCL